MTSILPSRQPELLLRRRHDLLGGEAELLLPAASPTFVGGETLPCWLIP
jgi:hypothetical protein